jgi:hypothetical protein
MESPGGELSSSELMLIMEGSLSTRKTALPFTWRACDFWEFWIESLSEVFET